MHEQAREILRHLMGKARNVGKTALHSNPALDIKQKPELIYNVLYATSVMFPLVDLLPCPDTEKIQSTAG